MKSGIISSYESLTPFLCNYLIEEYVKATDSSYFRYTLPQHPIYKPFAQGSKEIDLAPYQGPTYSYVHSMSSPEMSKGQAYVLAEMFKTLMYIGFCKELPGGPRSLAYKYLGFGLHTVMDNTSPSHEDFQFWPAGWFSAHVTVGIPHVLNEGTSKAEERKATTLANMRSYLNSETCSCEK